MEVTIVLQMLMQTRLIQMMFQYCRCVRCSDNCPTDANAD